MTDSESVKIENEGIKVIYFFSATCPRCQEANPYLKELSKEFRVEGILSGKEDVEGIPYPVKKWNREMAKEYGIESVPTIAILKDGILRQNISGEKDIRDSKVILKGFEAGSVSVSEALKERLNDDFLITGWVIIEGKYFGKGSKFFITDREKGIQINPWLPLEVIKSPFKKRRGGLMSDVIGKPVVLKGSLTKRGEETTFHVKEQINVD